MSIKTRVDSAIAALTAVLTKANATTHASDTDVDAAVDTLIAGYGQGGGSHGMYETTFVPASSASSGEVLLATSADLAAHRSDSNLIVVVEHGSTFSADSYASIVEWNGAKNDKANGVAFRYALASGGVANTRLYNTSLTVSSCPSGGMRIDSSGRLYANASPGHFVQGETYYIKAWW